MKLSPLSFCSEIATLAYLILSARGTPKMPGCKSTGKISARESSDAEHPSLARCYPERLDGALTFLVRLFGCLSELFPPRCQLSLRGRRDRSQRRGCRDIALYWVCNIGRLWSRCSARACCRHREATGAAQSSPGFQKTAGDGYCEADRLCLWLGRRPH